MKTIAPKYESYLGAITIDSISDFKTINTPYLVRILFLLFETEEKGEIWNTSNEFCMV